MATTLVLFDFDGTLADTLPLVLHAFRTVFRNYNHQELTDDQVLAFFGTTDDGVVERNLHDRNAVSEAIECYYDIYRKEHKARVLPDADITAMLDAFRTQGIKLGVITGKSRRAYDISAAELGLDGYFDIVVTGDDVERQKPDPEGILKALRTLGVPAEETIFLGDSSADIQAGFAAGLPTFGVHWLSTFQSAEFEREPHRIFTRVDDFLDYFAKGDFGR